MSSEWQDRDDWFWPNAGVWSLKTLSQLWPGYTTNGRDGTVKVFNLKTLQQLARIKVGTNPDAILYEPTTKRVFAFNGTIGCLGTHIGKSPTRRVNWI
jgi:YVTN family beta-propeller protein